VRVNMTATLVRRNLRTRRFRFLPEKLVNPKKKVFDKRPHARPGDGTPIFQNSTIEASSRSHDHDHPHHKD
jgi:hypothetical protein